MELPFTKKAGRRERHLRRRHQNPLFAWPPVEIEPEVLLAAQRADHEEMEVWHDSFVALVQKAVDLAPNVGSETLLGLKEELEKHYEQACGLPEDQEQEKAALSKLIGLVMKAVRQAAGNDPLARRELEDEEQARAVHFRLLEQPLVVDILYPESPIEPDELVPALLSASAAELEAALEVFDADQLALLVVQGRDLLGGLERARADPVIPRQRLGLLERELSARSVSLTDLDSTLGRK
jgi:hypothetical protein